MKFLLKRNNHKGVGHYIEWAKDYDLAASVQKVYEELVTPWMQVARKSVSEIPDSDYKTLLEEVPLSFANQLISKDKI